MIIPGPSWLQIKGLCIYKKFKYLVPMNIVQPSSSKDDWLLEEETFFIDISQGFDKTPVSPFLKL